MAKITVQAQIGNFTNEQVKDFEDWFYTELTDALASRSALEASWKDCLRMYEGVPKKPESNFPIENAPNLEVTLGAIASDSLFAQEYDLITSVDPIITCRPMPKLLNDVDAVASAKAMQEFANYVAKNEMGFDAAVEDSALDHTQLGTTIMYTPWVEVRKKGRKFELMNFGPKLRVIPIEDVIVPSGSYGDIQELRWIGLRFWLGRSDVISRSKLNDWNLGTEESPRFEKAATKDQVRLHRETLARSVSMDYKGDLYEIIDVYVHYDIDGDGIDEDLYVVYDKTSNKVLHMSYNPYDLRPLEVARFQKRAHLFYGMGVLEMTRPYEEGTSDFFNSWSLNAILCNTKHYISRAGTLPENWVIFPNKNTEVNGDPDKDVKVVDMGQLNASLPQAISSTISFAERRVGVNEMNTPRPSQVLGSRTPGITALTMMQQVSKRFTPAFSSFRLLLGNSVKQGLYRYQERVQAADAKVIQHIFEVIGPEKGMLVVEVLKSEKFDENMVVEMTASSAQVNKEADRQAAIQLMTLLGQYYQRILELIMLITQNPQVNPELVSVVKKIGTAAAETVERVTRTFDIIRDPETFVVRIEEEVDAIEAHAVQLQQMMDVANTLGPVIANLAGGGGGMPGEQGQVQEEGQEEAQAQTGGE